MRFRLILLIALTAGLVLGVAGCSDDDPVATTVSAKSYFTMAIYVNE